MKETNLATEELAIPQAAVEDETAQEVVRAWEASDGLHCSLRIGLWEDAGAWGVVLADIVQQVAVANMKVRGIPLASALDRIRAVFHAELLRNTSEVKGRFEP